MSDTRAFLMVLLVAILVPLMLLAMVRLAAWAVPPAYRWAVAFEVRHRFALGMLQAAVFLLWAFAMPDTGFVDLFFRVAFIAWAVEAFWNAVRYRRGQEDWFASFLKKRLTKT